MGTPLVCNTDSAKVLRINLGLKTSYLRIISWRGEESTKKEINVQCSQTPGRGYFRIKKYKKPFSTGLLFSNLVVLMNYPEILLIYFSMLGSGTRTRILWFYHTPW